jgi:hypothetical protein
MTFIWPESARAELRAIERETAIRILRALDRYGDFGEGDVRALTGQWQGYFRMRRSRLCAFDIALMFIAEFLPRDGARQISDA